MLLSELVYLQMQRCLCFFLVHETAGALVIIPKCFFSPVICELLMATNSWVFFFLARGEIVLEVPTDSQSTLPTRMPRAVPVSLFGMLPRSTSYAGYVTSLFCTVGSSSSAFSSSSGSLGWDHTFCVRVDCGLDHKPLRAGNIIFSSSLCVKHLACCCAKIVAAQ